MLDWFIYYKTFEINISNIIIQAFSIWIHYLYNYFLLEIFIKTWFDEII